MIVANFYQQLCISKVILEGENTIILSYSNDDNNNNNDYDDNSNSIVMKM